MTMMRREDKLALVTKLKEDFKRSPNFYLVDIQGLKGQDNNLLRRRLFEKKLRLKVVKNTLLKKALEGWYSSQNDNGHIVGKEVIEAIVGVLRGNTALIFAYDQITAPAKVIKAFREAGQELPKLKAAYLDGEIFIGDDKLEEIAKLKSKEELLGDLIGFLQAPFQSLLAILKSGEDQITSILKSIENRNEN